MVQQSSHPIPSWDGHDATPVLHLPVGWYKPEAPPPGPESRQRFDRLPPSATLNQPMKKNGLGQYLFLDVTGSTMASITQPFQAVNLVQQRTQCYDKDQEKGWCMNRTLFKKKDNNMGGEASVPNGAKMKALEFMLKN